MVGDSAGWAQMTPSRDFTMNVTGQSPPFQLSFVHSGTHWAVGYKNGSQKYPVPPLNPWLARIRPIRAVVRNTKTQADRL